MRDRLVGRFISKFSFGYGFAQFKILNESRYADDPAIVVLLPLEPWKLEEHQTEWDALQSPYKKETLPEAGQIQHEIFSKADNWAVSNLPHDLYKKWHTEMYGYPPLEKSSKE